MNKALKAAGKVFFRALGYYPATIGGYPFKLDPCHVGFWRAAAAGRWEPQTFMILSALLKPESRYCDVGAWIGPTVLYAAKKCRRVICFEPDPIAYRYLRWNIELNGLRNVDSFSVALSDRTAIERMASFRGELGDSTTSLLAGGKGDDGVEVLTQSGAAMMALPLLQGIDVIKIDIEGGEFALLPALREFLSRQRPAVYLSTHAPFLAPEARVREMRQVREIMGVYKRCWDCAMRPLSFDDLTGDAAVGDFRSYVFTD